MMRRRMQEKIAVSKAALPLTLVYTLGACLAAGVVERGLWLQAACLLLSVLLMVQLNNANALIRIYSRMVSCSYAVLSMTVCFILPNLKEGFIPVLAIASLIVIFRSYQDRRSMGTVFYAFALLGIASTLFVQILFFVPLLWVLMGTNLLSLSWRNLAASLLGVVFPYWFLGGYFLFVGQMDMLTAHFTSLADFSYLLDYTHVTAEQAVTFAYICVLGTVGAVHYLRNSYNDKIRTRMLFEFFITLEVATAAALAVEPNYYDPLIRLLIICVAPLIGHFIALTHTLITNIAFALMTLSALALTACNLLGIWSFSLIS